MSDGRSVWLYAVTRQVADGTVPSVRGVAAEAVRALTEGALTAIVGSVDARQFSPEALARNLEDLDWLAETARAHDAVIAAMAASGQPIVPVRLATLFSADDGVREMLRSRSDYFHTALNAVNGRTEWGVKAYVAPEALADSPDLWPDEPRQAGTQQAGAAQAPKGAGSAYLMRRRAQLVARRSAESAAEVWAQQIHNRLRPLSAASRLHPAQDPRLTGRRDWMILNAAYLVDRERTGQFQDLVEQLAAGRPGLDVQLTGPWPPYSFAAVPGARDD